MKAPEDRKAVAAALRAAVADDPEPCQVFGVSPSGLLEMTRRRGRPPLHELLCRPCGLAGSGREKTPETLAYEALRQLAAEAFGKPAAVLTLRVDRKSVVSGKRVPVRVDLGGRRILKKKKTNNNRPK